ncbi:hypothetical protein KCP76_08685 [Salmonella enterica subsp. enterica serovar Weltevreden]|nr:hypothetical protein KCP76_08685 [Salmonella enterica subsp. enterica serovar Weltevreden]
MKLVGHVSGGPLRVGVIAAMIGGQPSGSCGSRYRCGRRAAGAEMRSANYPINRPLG